MINLRNTLLTLALVGAQTLFASAQFAHSPETLSGTHQEKQALQFLAKKEYNILREKARQILKETPKSYPAHFMMAAAFHYREGDLNRAQFHLKKARELFDEAHPYGPNNTETTSWYETLAFELDMVLGELDDGEARLVLLSEIEKTLAARYGYYGEIPFISVLKVWPLMKMHRFEEAQKYLEKGHARPGDFHYETYLNTKGALEAEMANNAQSYQTFRQLLDYVTSTGRSPDPVHYSNTGESAFFAGRMDEAEKYYLLASEHFQPDSASHPWSVLTRIYLMEGRLAEAISSLQKTHHWTAAKKPYLAQQSRTTNLNLTAEVQLLLGYSSLATQVASTISLRPDRQGHDSFHIDQWASAHLLLYSTCLKAEAQELLELSSLEPWWERPLWWFQAQENTTKANWAGWQAIAIAAENDRLLNGLRPLNTAWTLMISDWQRPDLASYLGPGLTIAGVNQLLQDPKVSDLEHPVLKMERAEAYRLNYQSEKAFKEYEQVLESLPRYQQLSRFRVQTQLADHYWQEGETAKARPLFQEVLKKMPGMLRFLEVSLPTQITLTSNDPELASVAKALYRSPRFHPDPDGFLLKLSKQGNHYTALLLDQKSNQLRHVSYQHQVPEKEPPPDPRHPSKLDLSDPVVGFGKDIFHALFAPELDLTHADANSLDGSNASVNRLDNLLRQDFLNVDSQKGDSMIFPGGR